MAFIMIVVGWIAVFLGGMVWWLQRTTDPRRLKKIGNKLADHDSPGLVGRVYSMSQGSSNGFDVILKAKSASRFEGRTGGMVLGWNCVIEIEGYHLKGWWGRLQAISLTVDSNSLHGTIGENTITLNVMGELVAGRWGTEEVNISVRTQTGELSGKVGRGHRAIRVEAVVKDIAPLVATAVLSAACWQLQLAQQSYVSP